MGSWCLGLLEVFAVVLILAAGSETPRMDVEFHSARRRMVQRKTQQKDTARFGKDE